MAPGLVDMRGWAPRQWAAAAATAAGAALIIGVPTGIIRTPFYHRMTPVQWWNYPVWIVTAVLEGLILATYAAPGPAGRRTQGAAAGGGALSLIAVGCPVCNKLVVLAIGVSGALSYFAPLQPLLAAGSLALLAEALRRRLRATRACPAPQPPSG